MSEPRVFLDQDLRRIASYEAARSIPLASEVALASSDLPLKFIQVASFYGISGKIVDAATAHLEQLSLRSTLSRTPYEVRLAHALGTSEGSAAFFDLRDPGLTTEASRGQPTLLPSSVPPVRPEDGSERPSEAQDVSERGQTDGAEGLVVTVSGRAGNDLRPLPEEVDL